MNIYFWIPIGILVVLFAVTVYRKYRLVKNTGVTLENDHVTILTDSSFEDMIDEGITLIDFWAPWCSPCKILGPVINELAGEYEGKVKVCKLDVDDNGKTARDMKIRGIPTVMIFQDGVIVGHFVGVKPKSVYKNALKKLL